MRRVIALIGMFVGLLCAVPAQAAMLYGVAGYFDEFIPNPDDPDNPTYTDSRFLTFAGISDGSAPTTGSFESLDGFFSFDYKKFSLSTFQVQYDPDGTIEDLTGGDYFFFSAKDLGIVGFGKGSTLLFGGYLEDYVGCGCGGDPAPYTYNGTSFLVSTYSGGSFDDPIHFDGGDHFFYLDGVFIAADESLIYGVPEPASWMLMLLGFGLAGTAVRRRTALPLAA